MRNTICIFLVALFATKSFSQIKLDSGLVAYYPFNGDANDASINGNNAIFNNATLTSDRFGNPNNAYSFNGIDNYIRIPNIPAIDPSGQISLCVFVKPAGFYRGPCHGNSVLMKGDADFLPGNYLIRFDDNAYTFGNNCSTDVVDTLHQNFYSVNTQTPSPGYAPYINKDQWYCLIYTYDGSMARFYVDGVLRSSASAPGLSFTNNYDLFLGRLNDSNFPYWFNGVMDDLRIYNRAIPEQEVSALCPSGALPVTLYKFVATVSGKQILLNWNTENASDISDFIVERSPTGHSDFEPLVKIAAINNIHSYSFVDNTAGPGQNYYYRLMLYEKTGAINYSEIRTAKIPGKIEPVIVYPNPSTGSFKVKLNQYSGKVRFTVVNPAGRLLIDKSATISGDNIFPFDMDNAAPGIYWLKVETSHEEYISKIVVL